MQSIHKLFLTVFLLLGGCVRLPSGVQPVKDFDLNRYLGTWYEIARLDHSFERGLSRVTAEYTLVGEDTLKVVNRGFSEAKGQWKTAEGKARFVSSAEEGYLKVSFFGPFYGAYVIVELDHEAYRYALVCGPDRTYLWLLARQPKLADATLGMLVRRASDLGFPVDQLIYVSHEASR